MSCNSPVNIEVSKGRMVTVPCGRCQGCQVDRISSLSFRMEQQARYYVSKFGRTSSFVLLTYNDDELPLHGACKEDVVKFHKQLRQALSRGWFYSSVSGKRKLYTIPVCKDWKYFLVSEYGENTQRVHYHGVYFGLPDDVYSVCFRHFWRHGFVFVRPLRSGGCRYVLKYLEKARPTKEQKEVYESFGVNPPFRLFSRGIGLQYFVDNFSDIFRDKGYKVKGVVRPLPPYIKQKFGIYKFPDLRKRHELEAKAEKLGLSYQDVVDNSRHVREYSLRAKARLEGSIVDNSPLPNNSFDPSILTEEDI